MYTAVRIVKMNACRNATRTSNPVMATSMANEIGMTTMRKFWAQSAAHNTENVTNVEGNGFRGSCVREEFAQAQEIGCEHPFDLRSYLHEGIR